MATRKSSSSSSSATKIKPVESEKADQSGADQQDAKARDLRLRYIGASIMTFRYKGSGYQLIPGTIYTKLPGQAPQVKRLRESGELVEA